MAQPVPSSESHAIPSFGEIPSDSGARKNRCKKRSIIAPRSCDLLKTWSLRLDGEELSAVGTSDRFRCELSATLFGGYKVPLALQLGSCAGEAQTKLALEMPEVDAVQSAARISPSQIGLETSRGRLFECGCSGQRLNERSMSRPKTWTFLVAYFDHAPCRRSGSKPNLVPLRRVSDVYLHTQVSSPHKAAYYQNLSARFRYLWQTDSVTHWQASSRLLSWPVELQGGQRLFWHE